jgi:hypothetical protein
MSRGPTLPSLYTVPKSQQNTKSTSYYVVYLGTAKLVLRSENGWIFAAVTTPVCLVCSLDNGSIVMQPLERNLSTSEAWIVSQQRNTKTIFSFTCIRRWATSGPCTATITGLLCFSVLHNLMLALKNIWDIITDKRVGAYTTFLRNKKTNKSSVKS